MVTTKPVEYEYRVQWIQDSWSDGVNPAGELGTFKTEGDALSNVATWIDMNPDLIVWIERRPVSEWSPV